MSPDGNSASVTVRNTGARAGTALAELYASLPSSVTEPDRLVGWEAVRLQPQESRKVTISIEPLALAIYDVHGKNFVRPQGRYTFHAGSSSADLPASDAVTLKEMTLH